jgi:hypothetical protein
VSALREAAAAAGTTPMAPASRGGGASALGEAAAASGRQELPAQRPAAELAAAAPAPTPPHAAAASTSTAPASTGGELSPLGVAASANGRQEPPAQLASVARAAASSAPPPAAAATTSTVPASREGGTLALGVAAEATVACGRQEPPSQLAAAGMGLGAPTAASPGGRTPTQLEDTAAAAAAATVVSRAGRLLSSEVGAAAVDDASCGADDMLVQLAAAATAGQYGGGAASAQHGAAERGGPGVLLQRGATAGAARSGCSMRQIERQAEAAAADVCGARVVLAQHTAAQSSGVAGLAHQRGVPATAWAAAAGASSERPPTQLRVPEAAAAAAVAGWTQPMPALPSTSLAATAAGQNLQVPTWHAAVTTTGGRPQTQSTAAVQHGQRRKLKCRLRLNPEDIALLRARMTAAGVSHPPPPDLGHASALGQQQQQQQQQHSSCPAASIRGARDVVWLPPGGKAAAVGQPLQPELSRAGGHIDTELWFTPGGPNQYQRGPGDTSPEHVDPEVDEALTERRGTGRAVYRR